MHELKIVDAEARKDFEELLGITIHGDTVRLMHDAYVKRAAEIQAIQMAAAFRVKDARG